MLSRSFNPAKTRIKWLRANDKRSWFRGQPFAKPGEPDRAPRFFNHDPARNSWTPNGVKTCYYALDIYTAFMECSAVFREMDPAIARGEICIGASELEAGLPFRRALLENPAIREALSEAELDTLLDPTGYVGAAPEIVDQVIATVTQGGRLAHDDQGAT